MRFIVVGVLVLALVPVGASTNNEAQVSGTHESGTFPLEGINHSQNPYALEVGNCAQGWWRDRLSFEPAYASIYYGGQSQCQSSQYMTQYCESSMWQEIQDSSPGNFTLVQSSWWGQGYMDGGLPVSNQNYCSADGAMSMQQNIAHKQEFCHSVWNQYGAQVVGWHCHPTWVFYYTCDQMCRRIPE